MEQSFSKADRCFHAGRFGPKSAVTERRCISVLTMAEKSEQDILQGARRLLARAVKKYTGPQKKKRMDSGLPKKTKAGSEATFLSKKRKGVTETLRSLPPSSRRCEARDDNTPLSEKASKELALEKKRRLARAMNGHLLEEDEGPEPFTKAAAQREQHAQQDQKRIDAQTVRTENCKRLCTPQLWNWKSLGARKTWCTGQVLDRGMLCSFQLVQDPRDASVFLCDPDVISEKIYLLAMAQGECLLSKAVLHGKPGLKMEYHKEAFRRLR